jgi:hypothetical protein
VLSDASRCVPSDTGGDKRRNHSSVTRTTPRPRSSLRPQSGARFGVPLFRRGTRGALGGRLCLLQRGVLAASGSGGSTSRRLNRTDDDATRSTIAVATGLVGSHFHRNHRYPGPRPVEAERFFALLAGWRG